MAMMATQRADLVILGATPGGIAAAIASSRLSKTSILIERSSFIGGLPANGLGATDIATRGATGGLFLEFVHKIKEHYVASYGADSDQVRASDDGYHFEPSVAETVFNQWLLSFPQIKVLTQRQFDFEPEHVTWRGGEISSILVTERNTGQRETISGRFFLDCTYEGDLIAAAKVPFFVGREGQEAYGEMGAGRLYKLWNGPECAGSTHCGDNSVQSYNYRLCLTTDPGNRVEIKRPAHYQRQEFVSLIDDVRSGRHTGVGVLEVSPSQFDENVAGAETRQPAVPDALRGIRRLLSMVPLPNLKVDGNNQHLAFISTDLPVENWPYATSSWAWRDAFATRLREYTEGLLYFAQTDEELPPWFRDECRQWGWAGDEYAENGHFPRQVYVREGRRMRGKHIFTANDVLPRRAGPCKGTAETDKPDDSGTGEAGRGRHDPSIPSTSITASHYALDSHAVRKREPGRVHLDGFFSYPCSPYSVPYEVMVPDAPVTNLLAPVPVSATHVGFSTLRMEPCWMALGQAAGVAAALCMTAGVAAEKVNVDALQRELLRQGAVLIYDPRLWEDGVGAEEREAMQSDWLQSVKSRKDSTDAVDSSKPWSK